MCLSGGAGWNFDGVLGIESSSYTVESEGEGLLQGDDTLVLRPDIVLTVTGTTPEGSNLDHRVTLGGEIAATYLYDGETVTPTVIDDSQFTYEAVTTIDGRRAETPPELDGIGDLFAGPFQFECGMVSSTIDAAGLGMRWAVIR